MVCVPPWILGVHLERRIQYNGQDVTATVQAWTRPRAAHLVSSTALGRISRSRQEWTIVHRFYSALRLLSNRIAMLKATTSRPGRISFGSKMAYDSQCAVVGICKDPMCQVGC